MTQVPGVPKVGGPPNLYGLEERCMTIYFQYRDPLINILDYIVEVRQPGMTFRVYCG